MRVVILAGGLGTRLAEETAAVPKPMVTIGGKPMLWHIMKIYSHFGHQDFVVCLGYRGEVIKEWLLNLQHFNGSFQIDLGSGTLTPLGDSNHEQWRVMALDTGQDTQTGGRLKRAFDVIGDEEVMVTYGDGVADIDIDALLSFHRSHGKLATVTAVRPPARFGRIELSGSQVTRFGEKLQSEEGWINGGFMIVNRGISEFLPGDESPLESTALTALASEGQLMAYQHGGFWQPMDTLRERHELEALWATGAAPWAVW